MKKRVMISSFFSGNTNSMIVKLSITDMILIVEKNLENLKDEDIEKKKLAIKELQQKFGDIINISFIEVKSIYDIYEIARETVKKIDEIGDAEIIFNISEGRKPISFGMSFAAYLRKKKVNAIYYLIKEQNDRLLKMPFLNFSVNKTEREILTELSRKTWESTPLREKIKKSKSVFYKYLKNFQINGYIEIEKENIQITDLGRIVIL